MSGDSCGHLYFYAIAPDEVAAALDALDVGGFHQEYGPEPDPDDPPQIELDESHLGEGAELLDSVETGEALALAAPSATFRIWTEPAEGSLGICLIHLPGFGIWSGECDASGDPVVDGAKLREALDDAGEADLRQVVRDLTGERWTVALSAARRFLDAIPPEQRRVVASPTTPTRPPVRRPGRFRRWLRRVRPSWPAVRRRAATAAPARS